MYLIPLNTVALIRNGRTILLLAALSTLLACQNIDSTQSNKPSSMNAERLIKSESNVTTVSLSTIDQGAEVYDNVWERMRAGFELNGQYQNNAVAHQIETYSGNQRYFDLVTERATPFLYWIVDEIDRRNLPQELALLPFVESTFNPNAYSQEHAVGLWQFLGSTGKSFGLQQDWWYDGRRDPYASTIAALDFLEVLYKQFDDNWLIALAAYNTGEGNVRKAIRNSGNSSDEVDFWSLRLAGETRAHIPKLLALAAIISNAEAYDIELTPLPNQAVLTAVEIGSQIDISQAAKLADIDYAELRALNPGYLQWATHPDQPQHLLMPFTNASELQDKLANLSESELVTWDRYEILPGDTLGGIARKLNTRVDILESVNALRNSRIIAGNSLLIPRASNLDSITLAPTVRRKQNINVPASYTIKRGDNLWSIARRYNLKSKEIAAWNQIELDVILHLGQTLDLQYATHSEAQLSDVFSADSRADYLVRPGDSMALIARRFEFDLQDLLLWNDISINELIHPGQTIRFLSNKLEIN
ncbi:MAG: lytic transglycosylase [SAR86 cluster bacterium]|uniref:Lytic transglycosylase n=1 Tax=SAR86 cluster bacterium TaxID=2030880 RepID=A0A2A5BAE2_9GAMM|nr:MAG: lytic transglycosylase [SAR86 cluster bacterium]